MAPDVFISYSRRDKEFVQVLHDALLASKYDAWIDWQDIKPSTKWWKEIETGIEAAHTFIFVISQDSVASEYCRKEIDHAIRHGKRLIPVLRRQDFEPGDMHPQFRQHQWVAFQAEDDFATAFATLVEAIDTNLEHKKTHTRLQVRAIEWQQNAKDASLLLRGRDLEKAKQWLLQAAGQDPSPTSLQGEYIAASRKSSAGRQRTLIATLGWLLVLALVGGGFGYWQFGRASRALAESEQAKTAETKQREIAEAQRQEAETEKNRAENALKEADKQRQLAQLKQQEAEEALLQAETAQQAAAQQRQRAEQALVRAEEGEAEAQRQAKIARIQTGIAEEKAEAERRATQRAEQETTRAENLALNADIRAESLTVENLMASNLHFNALLKGLGLAQLIQSMETKAQAKANLFLISMGRSKQTGKPASSPRAQLPSRIWPEVKLQAAALREIYHYPGYLHRNTLAGHTASVWSVSFSPDGQTLASASVDGTVILWNFDLDDLITKSCNWLRDYMANPATPAKHRELCAEELGLPLNLSVPSRLNWFANVRAFWRAWL